MMRTGNRKKWLLATAALLIGVPILAAAGVVFIFKHAEPDYQGKAHLSGLTAPVEVFRDSYGIPHIFADSMKDAALALGYTHAGERLFQMEMQRRAGQGRLAEILGADVVDIDKFTRTLGLYKLAQSSYAAMSPEAQNYFQAYADGVNAWLQTHRYALPPELVFLAVTPEPWTPADSIVWGKLMGLELSHNYHLEMLRAQIAQKIPPEQMAWLFPMPPEDTPITTKPVAAPVTSRDANDRLASLLGLSHAASNEWVIGGARTATGKPMLANDPHLDLGAPILWYLARIITPQGSVKGATVPGLPLVLLGQNDHVAWGFTTTGSDVQDLFIETIDPQDPTRYLTPQGSVAFATRNEMIAVKNATPISLTIRSTRHGPVLSDINPEMARIAGAGKVMALAFTGLGADDRTSESLLLINRACNADEFLAALRLYQTPPQNMVYADDGGHFGFINPGLVPVRNKGDGLMPADGASGDFDWIGMIALSDDPQIADPDSGFIFNANNAVVAPDNPHYFGMDWEEPYRARRLQQLLASAAPFTLDKMAAMQADKVSLAAADFLPWLVTIEPTNVRARQALALLDRWDAVMDQDRSEPAIFAAWLYHFHRHMVDEKIGVDTSAKGPFAAMTLFDLVKNHSQEWCGDADCKKLMAQSFNEALEMMTARQGDDMTQWRWGRENVASLTHKFYSHIPLLDKISDLSVPSGGDFYTLDRGGGFDNPLEQPFARTHGGGFRGLYDLADPDASRFMISTGESDHLFSGHYGDLVEQWVNVKSITLSGTAASLRQKGAPELVLIP